MMVVIALLTVIVIGLYAMFNQTQRALISTTTQVDVLEPGRAALDLISRELEQMSPAGYVAPNYAATNLLLTYANTYETEQPLVDGTSRTNVLEDCYFLVRSNHWWIGDGFFVASATNGALNQTETSQIGVGTLFRFSPTNVVPVRQLTPLYLADMGRAFVQAKTNVQMAFPVIDGVVHFRVRPLDSTGRLITYSQTTNILLNLVYLKNSPGGLWERTYSFRNNALPAYLDLELGVLEPHVMTKANVLPNAATQKKYIEQQAGAVHLFHKLIPIRIAQP
ncbi:MAG: hypothetical protein M1608_02490 [Candidatus Omnitrophica bacterium]|nr:hypothetical protein [Candidatus Omnitrophota bacterium]